jgi:hypothetical protein
VIAREVVKAVRAQILLLIVLIARSRMSVDSSFLVYKIIDDLHKKATWPEIQRGKHSPLH